MNSNSELGNGVESEEEFSLNGILNKYLPFWPYFILLIILFLTGAWLYLRYTRPVYQTTATILIKDNPKGANVNPLEALDLFGTVNSVQNEAAILKSKTLMQEVVKNLHLYAPTYAKGNILIQSAYKKSPIEIVLANPDSIPKNGQLTEIPFSYSEKNQTVTVNGHVYPMNQTVVSPYGRIMFIENDKYNNKDTSDATTFYFRLENSIITANNLLNKITIGTDKLSNVINLSIQDEIPERGEDILNELLRVYNRASILDKNGLAENTLKFLDDRLKFISKDLDSIEQSLQYFKSSNKITDVNAQGQIYLQSVAATDQKLSEIDMQLSALDEVENYVKNNGSTGAIVPLSTGASVNPTLNANIQKLSELELQYTQLKQTVPENNPKIQALKSGINQLRPELLKNIQNQRKNIVAMKGDLLNTNRGYNSLLKTIPEKERELLSINRQQAIKSNIYTFLLQKREETALSSASTVPDSRIIDMAQTNLIPVSPKRPIIYLGAVILALIIGFGTIYIKDLLTTNIQSKEEIGKYTSIPIIGEVVNDKTKSSIVVSDGKRSFIAEQFRQLRTSLPYFGIDKEHKRVLITSSISGEGKSFIAVNLAISLSLMGKRVVILEMDLRKPKITELLTMTKTAGLSNYLIGKETTQNIIRDTGINNLYLIQSGPIPPNPSELISNGNLDNLLDELNKSFDYIIIDTAPIGPVTDAFILSPKCDLTLFIVRHTYSPKIFLKKLEDFRKSDLLKNPAIIFNGIKEKGVGGYRYGTYSKYGYGYGYGYTEETKKSWIDRLLKKQ